MQRSGTLVPYGFLAPFLLVFAVFWCWPLIESVLLSLQNTRSIPGPSTWM
jgi:lactose/L-arabinose transport system permease protein